MDTKQLRQKILDLAIRGKLVPQDPNDEPASVLLERVKAEKERLIAEGKIKRSKKSAASSDKPHYADWDLPNGWVRCNLIDICTVFSTGPFGSMVHKSDYMESRGIPIVNPMNIIDGCIVKEKLAMVSSQKAHELARYTLQKNDILIARRGDLSKCAIVDEQSSGWLCGTGSFFLHVPFVEPQYIMLFYLSEYVQTILKRECVGATMENLNQGVLGSLPLLLPPIEEQKRIIQKVKTFKDIIFNIDSGSQEIRRLTSQVKSRVLELAISGNLVPQDPADEPAADLLKRVNPNAVVSTDTSHYKFDIPNNWIISQLGNLFNHNTGKALNRSNREGTMLDYITTSNLYWDRFELENLKQMPFKDSEIDKCTVIKGDLLVCEGGDIGRAAIWNYDYSICIQNHIHRLRPIDKLLVFPRFYYYCFLLYKQQNLIGGKGIGIQGLSSNQLHKVVFPLPPFNEQKRITAKVDELFAVIDQIQQSLE